MDEINLVLIDDELQQLSELTERLVARGINVLSATDGDEALAIMKQLCIDVVVLEVGIGGMNGLSVLQSIKKKHPGVEVIILTSYADVQTTVEGMQGGAFDYLIKPTSADRLLSRIRDAHMQKILRECVDRTHGQEQG